MRRLVLGLVVALGMLAQERDFLTEMEVDQLRLVQEPAARLQLYASFANTRLDMLESLLGSKKEGRSRLIQQTLEDYNKIIDAMDTVADDALKRKVDISMGISAIVPQQKIMVGRLKQVQQKAPADLDRYEFALKQAVSATEDSLELNAEDLASRGKEIETKVAEEKEKREAMMGTKDLEEKKEAEKKEEEGKRKRPTLLRKGEKPGVPK